VLVCVLTRPPGGGRSARSHGATSFRGLPAARGCHSPWAVFLITRQDYELEASLSPASTCSTSAARTVHRCEPYQTREQTLQLALGQGVEIDIPNARIGTRALQPTKENLGGTGIRDCAPPQTTLDLRITRWVIPFQWS
jgi:hypothetical protein